MSEPWFAGNPYAQLGYNIALSGINSGSQNGAQSVGAFMNDLTGKTGEMQFNASEAEKTRQFNSAEAEKAFERELYMSNTALQRQMADAKLAGVNPYYLAGSGGASTPSVEAASAANAAGGASGSWSPQALIANVASMALRIGLMKSFTATAAKAAAGGKAASVVSEVGHQAQSAQDAARQAWLKEVAYIRDKQLFETGGMTPAQAMQFKVDRL